MLREKLKRLIQRLPIRLLLSVAAGIILSKILGMFTHAVLHWADVFPAFRKPMFDTKLVLIALAYHSVYAVIGAFLTAMLAKKQAKRAVYILGTKEAILWVLGMILLWKHSPAWYNLAKAVLGIPLAVLGGRLYAWYKRRKERKGKEATGRRGKSDPELRRRENNTQGGELRA